MKEILIIRGGAIGDFICTLPVISALRKSLPETQLSLLSYDRVLPLAAATGAFTKVRSIESRAFAGFFAARGELDKEWMEFFRSFGMVISFLYDPDEILLNNLKRCEIKTVLTLDPRPTDRHITEHLTTVLNRVAIFPEEFSPALELRQAPAPAAPQGSIALHCGSGSEKKNWAIANWRKILEFLISGGHQVVVIEGEADAERTSKLLSGIASPQLTVIRNKSLLEVAAVLKASRLFIGHDSGITHLASALGTPCLALFGPSLPHLWSPRSNRARVLWKNTIWEPKNSSPLQLEEISVDDNSPELVKAQLLEILEQADPTL